MDNLHEPWAQQLLGAVEPVLPRGVDINDLSLDGMFLLRHTNEKVLSALVNAGFLYEKDTGGTTWIKSNIDPKCGLAFFNNEQEPENDVWWFWNHRQHPAG